MNDRIMNHKMEAMWLTAMEGNYEKDSATKVLSKPKIEAPTSQMRSKIGCCMPEVTE